MRQGFVCVVLLPAVILAGLGGLPVEAATSCVLPDASPHTTFWYSSGDVSYCSDRMLNAFVFEFGTTVKKPQLVTVVGCKIQTYTLDGTAPQVGVQYSPWSSSWGTVNYPHNTHPFRHIALLEGFPYGVASFSTEGWALFKWTASSSGAVTGFSNIDHFKLPSKPTDPTQVLGSKMWWGLDGHAYIVSRYLEKQQSISTFKIADMGTGSAAPPLTIMASLPSPSGTSLFDIVRVGGQILLLQWGSGGLYVVDVSNPSSPVYLGKTIADHVNTMGNTDFGPLKGWGPAVVNKGTSSNPNWRGYVRSSDGEKLYIVDLNDPMSPTKLAAVTIPTGGTVKSIDSDGRLVVVNQDPLVDNDGNFLDLPKARYYSVDDDTFVEIPSHVNWYPHNNDANEQPQDVALLPGSTQYRTFRSCLQFAYQDTVEVSCLSSTPTASLSVTRATGMPGTPSCSAPTGAVKGFPGDGFVLANQSSSGTTLEELVITGPDQFYENVTGGMLGGSMTWTSPTDKVGTFTLTLKVRDAEQNLLTDTGTIFLCDNPVARLALTHVKAPGGSWQACTSCSWLQGYSLRFSTLTSDGHPVWSADNPVWMVQLCPTGAGCTPSTDFVNNLNGTMDLTLASTGDYKVGAGVAFPFLELPVATTEATAHSGAITAAFTAVQGANTIGPGGAVMVTSPLNLTFTGQVAPNNTATCSWALTPNVWSSANVPCGNGATIPASTLTNGQQYTLQLTAVSSPVADQAVASLTFTGTDIVGDFSWAPTTPNIGQTVQFSASGLPTGKTGVRWTFPASGCSASDTAVKYVPCGMISCDGVDFTFKTSGVKSVSLAVAMDNPPTNYTTVATREVTVNNVGSCPTTCTGPGTPNTTSPKNTTVPAGTVTFQWTAVSGTSPITYDVYFGGMKLCSSTTTSCSTTMVAGSYSWTVKASNACGTATSAAASFTVGSACTMPSAPSNVAPTHGAQVPAGNVTFSWTASSGSPTPTYDLYFGQLRKASGITGTSVTTAVVNGTYQWTITARNDCGSASSTATTVTVGEPCVAPGQPTNPTPANNGVVQPGNVTLSWSAPATGNSLTYDVFVGGLKVCSSVTATQCVVQNLVSGTRSWYVQAKNSCGTGTSATWSFSICQATAVPVASFTWTPKDPVTIGGVLQDQPYVGQAVTFDPSATTNFPTSFEWTDFSQSPWATYTVANPTHTWQSPGDKIVRMKATNCIGTSAQVPLTVKVYPDIRPVVASFTSHVADAQNPQVVTFNAATGSSYGDPNYYIWDFGDGETASGSDKAEVVHTFKCGRTFPVKLISRRIKSGSDVRSQATTRDVVVGGSQCSPQSLMVMDVARNLPGNNGALWNTDLTLYNPTENDMDLRLAVKRPDSTPREESGTFTLPAGETRSLEWVLSKVEIEFSKASLWFYQADPIYRGVRPLPIISARTHTGAVAPFDDYGQFVMVYQVYQASTKKLTLYFAGLRHNGKTAQTSRQGFRTNMTIVEPAGVGWAADDVKLILSKADDPTFVKERQLWASGKYGYWQKSLDSFFTDLAPEDDLGQVILRVEIEPGAAIALGSSLINNGTNAPVFVPAQEAP